MEPAKESSGRPRISFVRDSPRTALPWAAACLLLGQAPRAVALAVLYAVISAVHSFLEPKVMAAQAGLPPLAALAAMYAGFRAFGVAGMILLPVALLFVKQLHDQGYVGLWK